MADLMQSPFFTISLACVYPSILSTADIFSDWSSASWEILQRFADDAMGDFTSRSVVDMLAIYWQR